MSCEVRMDRVTVRYGQFEALKDVSLRLEEGKIYALLGRNGAGKTTLLSLIASFMEPSEGQVFIGGQNPFEHAERMSQVAFVYQWDASGETETVKGMLESAERYRPNFDREYAEHLLKRFRLPLDQQVKGLSKGLQSALNVTIGLANRSPVTIFDEAYLGMDAPARETFYKELLEDQERHPRTIILSTHLVSEMDYLFEEVIILHKGKLLLQEPIDRLLERGVSVTGAAHAVDSLIGGMKTLNVRQLGGTKSAMVFGELSEEKRREAQRLGLEIGPVSLQDLFIHLTSEGDEHGIQP